jgi:hypothetical protein
VVSSKTFPGFLIHAVCSFFNGFYKSVPSHSAYMPNPIYFIQ